MRKYIFFIVIRYAISARMSPHLNYSHYSHTDSHKIYMVDWCWEKPTPFPPTCLTVEMW